MRGRYKYFRSDRNRGQGFSLLELIIVGLVILVLVAIATPQCLNAMHMIRLRGAVTDLASLVQVQRIRALDDGRFYSSYILPANGNNPQMAYVDILPQNVNGSSGTGGTVYNIGDPLASISSEVSAQPLAAAPNTANLKQQLLPANSPVIPLDGSAAGTPVTFGPQGLPCAPTAVTGGTVCNSLGGPTAYWIFLQNNINQNWGAVTVTPAGRIRRWYFAGGTWASF